MMRNPFSSLLGWYLRRHLAWRIAIGAGIAILVIAALYVGARGLQYAAAKERAPEFLPEEADVRIELPDLAGTFRRIGTTDAWKTIDRKLLRDFAIREPFNDALRQAGLPTLDDLEDRRFHRETGGWYTTESILRFAGKDVSAAVRVEGERAQFVAATRISFREYLILPFAWLVPGTIGAEKETVRGHSCLRLLQQGKPLWIASVGATVLASSSKELLDSALQRSGLRDRWEGAFRAHLDFRRSSAMKEVRQNLALGLLGGLLRDVDLSRASAVEIRGDVADRDLVMTARFEGVPERKAESPVRFADYAPADSAGFVASTTSAADLWIWLQEILAPKGQPETMFLDGVKELVKMLRDSPFEGQLLPRLGDGVGVVLGSEVWSGDRRRYPAAVLVVPARDSKAAVEALQLVIRDLWHEDQFTHGTHQGYPFSSLTKFMVRLREEAVVRFSYAALGDAILIGNNPEFVQKMIDAACATSPSLSLSRSRDFRDLEKDLGGQGLGRLLDPGAPLTCFLSFGPLLDSLDGFNAIVAEKMADNDKARTVLLNELRREGLNQVQIDAVFQVRLQQKIAVQEEELRRRIRFLTHLRWLVLQAKPGKGVLEIRAILRTR